jgi:seryl-tRNA synthetase
MRSSSSIERELRHRKDTWSRTPGLVGLRGDTLRLFGMILARIESMVRDETRDEIRTPPALPFQVLERASYFDSFPHWLTVAAHLGGDPSALEAVARAPHPGELAATSLAPAGAALSPALCYHAYDLHADSTIESPTLLTTQGTCWRHESTFEPLARAWAFTMLEVVCMGTSADVAAFRTRWIARVQELASALGLDPQVAPATDPFFAPTSRGRELLQRLKGLKDELLLPVGGGRHVAAASFNHHETFFGSSFGIRLPDGSPAASGCVAFGLERWTLAFLVAHGTDPRAWPALEAAEVATGVST